MEKSYFGLVCRTYFIDDDDKKSDSSQFVVCVSCDREKLLKYANVLNDAEQVKNDICPRNTIHACYSIEPMRFVL